MDTNPQRIEQFKHEIQEMRVHAPEDASDRRWLIAGLALPVIGLVVIGIGWWGVSGTAYPAEQLPYLVSGGIVGMSLVVIGAAVFVRYSLSRYLRFWLIRMVYEERAQVDREVEALERIEAALRGTGSATDAPGVATSTTSTQP
jgi:hypothetical protein